MRIAEIEGFDMEEKAADNLKQNAKRVQQQAKTAQARVKIKKGQDQLANAMNSIPKRIRRGAVLNVCSLSAPVLTKRTYGIG